MLNAAIIVIALRRSVSLCFLLCEMAFAGARSQRLPYTASLGTFLAEQESTAHGRGKQERRIPNFIKGILPEKTLLFSALFDTINKVFEKEERGGRDENWLR